MKICVLETSPEGPISRGNINKRKQFIENDKCDFFFVTHNKEAEGSLSFRSGHKWASNRNFLASHALDLDKYDYFWFTDYDVSYTSKTKLNVVDQIIKDLEEYNPAVMVCFDPVKQSSNSHKNIYLVPDTSLPIRSALMTNNQMKIVHKSLIKYFFPMPLRFGSVWDTCMYFNLLEIPFIGHTAMTYNVHGSGLVSEAASQGTQNSLNALFNSMKNIIHFGIKNTPAETSTLYQIKSRHTRLIPNQPDVNYFDEGLLSKYFDLKLLKKFREDG